MIVDTMTGDNSDVTLTLSVAPVSENNVQVYFDGVYQSKANYSISGTTLTFSTAPATGVAVEAITHTQTTINEPAANTVTPAKIASGDFYFDTDTLYIDATNNRVGIGTTSPASALHVSATSPIINLQDSNGSGNAATPYLQYKDSGGTDLGYVGYGSSGNSTLTIANIANDNIDFLTNGTQRMRIDSAGDVIIGTTASIAGSRLTLETGNNTKIVMRSSSASAGEYWRQEVDASNDFYLIDNNSTGVYITDGSTSWSGASDENLKENIVELTGVLDKVRDFRCVEYNLIADEADSKKIGFIAQDWQEDYSQVVSQDNNGNLGMKYTETIPVLLKAIQEQQALIEAQATTITDLTTRIETLENA
jgi:hypothetical protein